MAKHTEKDGALIPIQNSIDSQKAKWIITYSWTLMTDCKLDPLRCSKLDINAPFWRAPTKKRFWISAFNLRSEVDNEVLTESKLSLRPWDGARFVWKPWNPTVGIRLFSHLSYTLIMLYLLLLTSCPCGSRIKIYAKRCHHHNDWGIK